MWMTSIVLDRRLVVQAQCSSQFICRWPVASMYVPTVGRHLSDEEASGGLSGASPLMNLSNLKKHVTWWRGE